MDPPQDEAAFADRAAIASLALAGFSLVVGPVSMVAGVIAMMAVQSPLLNDVPEAILCTVVSASVIGVGFGAAALLTETRRKGMAIVGTVGGAIVPIGVILIGIVAAVQR